MKMDEDKNKPGGFFGGFPPSDGYAPRRIPRRRTVAEIEDEKFEGIEITDDFQSSIDYIARNGPGPLIITGAAGTGKSMLVRYLRYYFSHKAERKKNIAIVAPTGVAALSAKAQTIHSFFGFPPITADTHLENIKSTRRDQLFQNLDTLIIDEISMVRADMFDAIEKSLRVHIDEKQDFGGVQIVMVGDFLQLPPIVKQEEWPLFGFGKRYTTHYVPGAMCLQNREVHHIIDLPRYFRQLDEKFTQCLHAVRERAENCEDALQYLNQHCVRSNPPIERGVILMPYKRSVEETNRKRLDAIQYPLRQYEGKFEGEFRFKEGDDLPVPFRLDLKREAQIMLVKNDSAKRWVNGDLADIVALGDNQIKIRLHRDNSVYDVQRASWPKYQTAWDQERGCIVYEEVGKYEQFPMRLAWAITIHKSQGLTLDKATVDITDGVHDSAFGQVYVALSRCRTIDGLSLTRPITEADVKVDDAVLKWYKKLEAQRNNPEIS